jgi:glycerol kinase
MAEAMRHRSLQASDLAAIGITNQRETAVVWNRTNGKPVCNAIVWQDTRVGDAVQEFSRQGGQDRFRAQTGLPLSTYFSSLKVRWILNNIPGVRELAGSGDVIFGTVDAYLLWNLTGGVRAGVHATDVTNASRTQLMDLATLAWDRQALETFGIPAAMLPEIRSSSEIYGYVAEGPLAGAPIAGILGDQQAALVGQTCFDVGQAKNTYGTGCFMLLNTGERAVPSQYGLLTTVAYKLGTQEANYALEGSVAIAGALMQWLRDNLGLIEKSSDVEALARTEKDNGGVYFVPAFSGLYAPYWKSTARGIIAGLTRYANKGHIARASLEATAFQTLDVLDAMEKDSHIKLDVLRVDGGMVENELLMQFQSDILGRPVVRPAVKETTALGAAYAAGLAVGYFGGLDELRANWAVDRTWTSNMQEEKRAELCRLWKRAVTKSHDWID